MKKRFTPFLVDSLLIILLFLVNLHGEGFSNFSQMPAAVILHLDQIFSVYYFILCFTVFEITDNFVPTKFLTSTKSFLLSLVPIISLLYVKVRAFALVSYNLFTIRL